jgi:hypothetical protein
VPDDVVALTQSCRSNLQNASGLPDHAGRDWILAGLDHTGKGGLSFFGMALAAPEMDLPKPAHAVPSAIADAVLLAGCSRSADGNAPPRLLPTGSRT